MLKMELRNLEPLLSWSTKQLAQHKGFLSSSLLPTPLVFNL